MYVLEAQYIKAMGFNPSKSYIKNGTLQGRHNWSILKWGISNVYAALTALKFSSDV